MRISKKSQPIYQKIHKMLKSIPFFGKIILGRNRIICALGLCFTLLFFLRLRRYLRMLATFPPVLLQDPDPAERYRCRGLGDLLKSLARKNNNTRQRKSKEKQDSVYRRYTHHRRRAFLLDFIGLLGFCAVRIPSRALSFCPETLGKYAFPGLLN